MKFFVEEEIELLKFLFQKITNKSKNTIKNILTNGLVLVDEKVVTKYNYLLKKGQKVTILNKLNINNISLDIIYEDKNIIVVNKPSGLLTIATNKETVKTLYHYVLEYLKQKKENVFVIHRLDKDTSGIVMFAKNVKVKNLYQDNWNNLVLKRGYFAIVKGIIESGYIKSYLKENKNGFVYVTKDKTGKEAITYYKKIKENSNYTLLDVDIKTGRKNQIRVQFSSLNHPIVGDKKYGDGDNVLNRLALHAYELKIINPLNKKEMIFKSSIPESFNKLF